MIEQHVAPVGPVTPRSLSRRRARLATASRRATTVATALTLLTGGIALANHDDAPAKPAPIVAAASVEPPTTAVAAASTDGAPVAEAPAPEAAPPVVEDGPAYRLAAADGGVFNHGWYDHEGSAAGVTSSPVVGMAQTKDGEGYWLTAADGGVFAFGAAPFQGSGVGQVGEPVVDIAATPSEKGYWLASRDGGVFTFGDAAFHGAAVGTPLSARVVSIAATPSGNGYWLVAGDGGVFTFGDATFHGAAVGGHLNAPIIDLVPTPTGAGYYLVSADGGVFAFGDAPFHGSVAGQRLNRAIVDMALDTTNGGYWLVGGDGGVFAFGGAPFLGSPATRRLNSSVVGIAGGRGKNPPPPAATVEAASVPTVTAPAPAAPSSAAASAAMARGGGARLDGKFGWDISYPQCGGAQPSMPFDYGIVGINGGRAFRHNKCLAQEWQWARQTAAGVYVNVNFPRSADELARGATSARQPNCNGAISCVAYNFGFNGIHDAWAYASSQGVDAPFIWLDVEQLNYWTQDRPLNAVVLRGAIDAARELGKGVGIYSTPYQFTKIMGAEAPGVPVWTAGAPDLGAATRYCTERGFGGGPVAIVQLLPGQFDPNLACPGAGAIATYFKTN